MDSAVAVTHWFAQARQGNFDAAQPHWGRYFTDLVRRARGHLRSKSPPAVDGDDAALEVLDRCHDEALAGRFPQLSGRDTLWPWLVVRAARRAVNPIPQAFDGTRESGKVWGGSRQPGNVGDEDVDLQVERRIGMEPTPAFAAEVAENVARLLEVLEFPYLREVAALKIQGYTNAEIASKQGVLERRVERGLGLIRGYLSSM